MVGVFSVIITKSRVLKSHFDVDLAFYAILLHFNAIAFILFSRTVLVQQYQNWQSNYIISDTMFRTQ